MMGEDNNNNRDRILNRGIFVKTPEEFITISLDLAGSFEHIIAL